MSSNSHSSSSRSTGDSPQTKSPPSGQEQESSDVAAVATVGKRKRKSKRTNTNAFSSPPSNRAPSVADVESSATLGSPTAASQGGGGGGGSGTVRKVSEQKRRVMMNQHFNELVALLAMFGESKFPKKMDKVTTLKEAVSYIKVYHELTNLVPPKRKKFKKAAQSQPQDNQSDSPLLLSGDILQLLLSSMDSFMMVISEQKVILFCTELVTTLLGHMQAKLVGKNVMDFVLERDRPSLASMFDNNGTSTELPCSQIIAYPSRQLRCHFKLYSGETEYCPQYLPFNCLSFLRVWKEKEKNPLDQLFPPESETFSLECNSCILLVAKLPNLLSLIDLPIGTNEVNFQFDVRVSREGKVIDIDSHATLVMGYISSEMVGSSFFDYIDPYHLTQVGEAMSVFLNRGLGTTMPYRLRTKGERYLWVISKGYLAYNPWNHKPDHILLSTQVLGCEQVLPEHRFYRSRKLVPDMEEDCYEPPPLLMSNSNPKPASPPTCTTDTTTRSYGVVAAGGSNSAPRNGNSSSNNNRRLQTQSAQQQQQQATTTPRHHHHSQSLPHVPTSVPVPTTAHPPLTMAMMFSTEEHQPVLHQAAAAAAAAAKEAPPPVTVTQSRGSTTTSSASPHHHHHDNGNGDHRRQFEAMEQELERKRQELFDMQSKLLEQQQLMEKERNQFYQVTQQVVQYLGTPAPVNVREVLPPGMQMAMLQQQQQQRPQAPLAAMPVPVVMAATCTGPSKGTVANVNTTGSGLPSWYSTLTQQLPGQSIHPVVSSTASSPMNPVSSSGSNLLENELQSALPVTCTAENSSRLFGVFQLPLSSPATPPLAYLPCAPDHTIKHTP